MKAKIKHLEEGIRDFELRLKAAEQGRDMALEQFIGHLPALLDQWVEAEVNRARRERPEQLKALGAEGVAKLKAELAAFRKEISMLVEQEVRPAANWPEDLTERDQLRFAGSSFQPVPDPAEKAIQKVMGPLGPILRRADLIPKGYGWDGMEPGQSPRLRGIHGTMATLLNEHLVPYWRHYSEATDLRNRLKDLRRQKTEAEAELLWDEA